MQTIAPDTSLDGSSVPILSVVELRGDNLSLDMARVVGALAKKEKLETELLTQDLKSYGGELGQFYTTVNSLCHVSYISPEMSLVERCPINKRTRKPDRVSDVRLRGWGGALSYLGAVAQGIPPDQRTVEAFTTFAKGAQEPLYLLVGGSSLIPTKVEELGGLLVAGSAKLAKPLPLKLESCTLPQVANGNELANLCRSALPLPPLAITIDGLTLDFKKDTKHDTNVVVLVSKRSGSKGKPLPIAYVPVHIVGGVPSDPAKATPETGTEPPKVTSIPAVTTPTPPQLECMPPPCPAPGKTACRGPDGCPNGCGLTCESFPSPTNVPANPTARPSAQPDFTCIPPPCPATGQLSCQRSDGCPNGCGLTCQVVASTPTPGIPPTVQVRPVYHHTFACSSDLPCVTEVGGIKFLGEAVDVCGSFKDIYESYPSFTPLIDDILGTGATGHYFVALAKEATYEPDSRLTTSLSDHVKKVCSPKARALVSPKIRRVAPEEPAAVSVTTHSSGSNLTPHEIRLGLTQSKRVFKLPGLWNGARIVSPDASTRGWVAEDGRESPFRQASSKPPTNQCAHPPKNVTVAPTGIPDGKDRRSASPTPESADSPRDAQAGTRPRTAVVPTLFVDAAPPRSASMQVNLPRCETSVMGGIPLGSPVNGNSSTQGSATWESLKLPDRMIDPVIVVSYDQDDIHDFAILAAGNELRDSVLEELSLSGAPVYEFVDSADSATISMTPRSGASGAPKAPAPSAKQKHVALPKLPAGALVLYKTVDGEQASLRLDRPVLAGILTESSNTSCTPLQPPCSPQGGGDGAVSVIKYTCNRAQGLLEDPPVTFRLYGSVNPDAEVSAEGLRVNLGKDDYEAWKRIEEHNKKQEACTGYLFPICRGGKIVVDENEANRRWFVMQRERAELRRELGRANHIAFQQCGQSQSIEYVCVGWCPSCTIVALEGHRYQTRAEAEAHSWRTFEKATQDCSQGETSSTSEWSSSEISSDSSASDDSSSSDSSGDSSSFESDTSSSSDSSSSENSSDSSGSEDSISSESSGDSSSSCSDPEYRKNGQRIDIRSLPVLDDVAQKSILDGGLVIRHVQGINGNEWLDIYLRDYPDRKIGSIRLFRDCDGVLHFDPKITLRVRTPDSGESVDSGQPGQEREIEIDLEGRADSAEEILQEILRNLVEEQKIKYMLPPAVPTPSTIVPIGDGIYVDVDQILDYLDDPAPRTKEFIVLMIKILGDQETRDQIWNHLAPKVKKLLEDCLKKHGIDPDDFKDDSFWKDPGTLTKLALALECFKAQLAKEIGEEVLEQIAEEIINYQDSLASGDPVVRAQAITDLAAQIIMALLSGPTAKVGEQVSGAITDAAKNVIIKVLKESPGLVTNVTTTLDIIKKLLQTTAGVTFEMIMDPLGVKDIADLKAMLHGLIDELTRKGTREALEEAARLKNVLDQVDAHERSKAGNQEGNNGRPEGRTDSGSTYPNGSGSTDAHQRPNIPDRQAGNPPAGGGVNPPNNPGAANPPVGGVVNPPAGGGVNPPNNPAAGNPPVGGVVNPPNNPGAVNPPVGGVVNPPNNPGAANPPVGGGVNPPKDPGADSVSPPAPRVEFKDVQTNPEIMPAKTVPEKTIINPIEFPEKGAVKTRQQIDTECDPTALAEACGVPIPGDSNTKGKVALVNHDYHDSSHPANFKIVVKIGRNELVLGFDPKGQPGVPDFTGHGRILPEGTRVMKKSTYDKVLAKKGEVFEGFRFREGIIEKESPAGIWEPYMNSHWPYGTQK